MRGLSFVVAGLMVLAVSSVKAVDVFNLTAAEGAAWGGASVMVVVDHEDLTTTTTNTAQVLTLDIAAREAYEVVCSVLEVPFVDASTNANNTLTLIVGDGDDTDHFLASQELASDGTEVLFKVGTGTIKAYTAVDTLDLTFTPHSNYGVAAMDAGKVRLYLRRIDGRY